MTLREVCNFLEISRASLYRVYLKPGKLTPIRNSALPRPRLKFYQADVYALRPDKVPHLDQAPSHLVAEDPTPYDQHA
jgi:predicted site-specific integrase-resolvase